jgi:hypothetical protein
MMQYLLTYRQSSGTLLELRELGEDVQAAMRERFKVELERRGDPDVEVVLLSAASREALMRTHARYFRDRRWLAADLDSSLST